MQIVRCLARLNGIHTALTYFGIYGVRASTGILFELYTVQVAKYKGDEAIK